MEIENEGLLIAFDIGADRRARPIGWDELDTPVPDGGWRWMHFHRNASRAQAWLLDGDIPPNSVAWALMAEDTRPRFTELEGGDVLFLRGINLNEGAEPEDMVSLRLSISETHVVSVAIRGVDSVDALADEIGQGYVPPNPGEFVERMVHALRERVEPELDALEDLIEEHELDALSDSKVPTVEMRNAFTDARQDAVMIRRHLVPQAAALRDLMQHAPEWLHRTEVIAEEAAACDRVAEDLDSLRERAAVLRDEMSVRQAERMNETMLVLSVVSAVFLPITFVTGLLGMNVGGLPLADSPYGFWIVAGIMLVMVAASIFAIRRLGAGR